VVGGFVMLLHQAVEQVRLFTGRLPDVEAMRAAGLRELADRG
jgi:shikimate dehydrogenase